MMDQDWNVELLGEGEQRLHSRIGGRNPRILNCELTQPTQPSSLVLLAEATQVDPVGIPHNGAML